MCFKISWYLLTVVPVILYIKTCTCTSAWSGPPAMWLYAPGEPEYTDVLVRREGDNLTLVCEVRGGQETGRLYVWNYVPQMHGEGSNVTYNDSSGPAYVVHPATPGPVLSSRLVKTSLRLEDSGHYVCSSPPHHADKYILVQAPGPRQCARGAFWCGSVCVLAAYVCDGYRDCKRGEDEHPALCDPAPCNRADKLNCSAGRCVSSRACCRAHEPLCRQPACCDEHARYTRPDNAYVDVEYPPLFEDRHAPDDYGFIQSTIYTVTACALIFMIAVVLLVSAICKMHMKRAALRSYDRRDARYDVHYAQIQTHRFPPCYEASRLLHEAGVGGPGDPLEPLVSAHSSPRRAQHSPQHATDQFVSGEVEGGEDACPGEVEGAGGLSLARLTAVFTNRYRQVSAPCDVELVPVPARPAPLSPRRAPPPPPPAPHPAGPPRAAPAPAHCVAARHLNYPTHDTPQSRPRPLTLQLGRFHLSLPRLSSRRPPDRAEGRPDTPNVTQVHIDDMDFRPASDTYTLNGRTIRLLGAEFRDVTDTSRIPPHPADTPAPHSPPPAPPPYCEAVRYKRCGPPPPYLLPASERRARSDVELPPRYDELPDDEVTSDGNGNDTATVDSACSVAPGGHDALGGLGALDMRALMSRLPDIDCDVNANDTERRDDNDHAATILNNNVC